MPPQLPPSIFCLLAAVISGALKPPTLGPTDATGPLPEGDNGYFCKTRNDARRLFRRGDFFFCGTDGHFPQRLTYALLGNASAMPAAVQRFAHVLSARTGVEIESGSRPDVLLVAAPAKPSQGVGAQRKEVEAMLGEQGVTLPPDLAELAISRIDLDRTPGSLSDTMSYDLRPGGQALTVVTFYAGSGANMDQVAKDAFTAYLAIRAPMVRPEQAVESPREAFLTFPLRPWLDP